MGLLFAALGKNTPSAPRETKRPDRPDLLDENNFMKDQFRLSNHTNPYESIGGDALNKLYERATSEGPTQSAQYLMDQNNALTNQARSNQKQQNAGQFQSLVNNMAMRGGMDRGSRLRSMNQMNRNNMMSDQNLNVNRLNNEMDILQKDEASKFSLLGQMPSRTLDYANYELGKDKFDIGNSINTANNYYNQDMSQWAALNSANQAKWAAENTGGLLGKGGFMGSGIKL
tara:strand:+ start:6351 stop:7037 length:687 start_codon:yes stop_codon:yes gene_type:complete